MSDTRGDVIHPEAESLSRCEPVNPDKIPKYNGWWDTHRTDILIPKERTRKEGKGDESQVSLKPSKTNSISS